MDNNLKEEALILHPGFSFFPYQRQEETVEKLQEK
jgi:hypothetical protein